MLRPLGAGTRPLAAPPEEVVSPSGSESAEGQSRLNNRVASLPNSQLRLHVDAIAASDIRLGEPARLGT